VLCGLSGGCGSDDGGDGGDQAGLIVTVTSRFANDGGGTLVAFDPETPKLRVIAENVNVQRIQPVAPGVRKFPFGHYRVDDDQTGRLYIADLDTGEVEELTRGHTPFASAERLAFCSGAQLLIAPLDRPADTTFVATLPSGTGCTYATWIDDVLAFLEIADRETGTTLYLWDGACCRKIEVDVPVIGRGPLSASSNGRFLMYDVDGQIVEIDLDTSTSTVVGDGYAPKFSPIDSDLFAVLTREPSLELRRRDGSVIAEHPLKGGESDDRILAPFDISWSPAGDAIAIASSDCITIWHPEDGSSSCVAKPERREYFLPIVLWFR
jgi:hypothetical protein